MFFIFDFFFLCRFRSYLDKNFLILFYTTITDLLERLYSLDALLAEFWITYSPCKISSLIAAFTREVY